MAVEGDGYLLHGGFCFVFGEVACPDDDYLPSGVKQQLVVPSVPFAVTGYLVLPEGGVGLGQYELSASLMSVPKQPLTKIAVLYLRMTMSGLPGTLLTLSRYRYPCAQSHFRTVISGLVALLRICDMQRWRCAGVRTSGILVYQ